nr:hypothetical protein [uncultured Halomonas sp.]
MKTFKAKLLGIEIESTGESIDKVAERQGKEELIEDIEFLEPSEREYAQAYIEALEGEADSDPDVKLFLGVYKNNKKMMSDAIKSGADPKITDIQIIKRYQAELESLAKQNQIKKRAYEIAQERKHRNFEQ